MIIGKCPICGEEMRIGSDMTNADRIRSMTDEELAGWLVDNMDCFNCRVKHTCQIMNGDCLAAWLVWLKEEAKDGI